MHEPDAAAGGGTNGFERPFWWPISAELFERLSYYAGVASLARYLHETLSFPLERAADLFRLVRGLVWFLAILGGAIADRLGFRRALSLAYLISPGPYFLLGSLGAPWLAAGAQRRAAGGAVTIVLMLPALGVALVKPSVVGRRRVRRMKTCVPSAIPSTTRW